MAIETIIEIVSYAVLAIGSVVIQVVNFCRTGRVPDKVAKRLTQSLVPSSVADQVEVSKQESSCDSAKAQHELHEVIVDHDYDIAYMSRSMYDYFLECERKAQEVDGVGGH